LRLWFIATIEDLHFYMRCKNSTGESFYLVHLNLLTYIAAIWLRAGSGRMVWKKDFANMMLTSPKFNLDDTKISSCFNVLAGRLNLEDAYQAYVSTFQLMSRLNSEAPITKFVIPSGRHIHHLAATDFAKKNKISRLYINYGNFPGRTFFDPYGTDAESSVYTDGINPPENFTEKEANFIIQKALFEKREQSAIPQKTSYQRELFKSLVFKFSAVIERCLGICGDRRIISLPKSGSIFIADINDEETLKKLPPYFFFPLQVSTDVQIVRNYKGCTIENAIIQATDYAKKNNKLLIMKLHPGEKDQQTVINTINLQRKSTFLKTANLHTDILIKHAEKVITVNSTVGLEAKLHNRDVHFFGKSMYDDMDIRQMAWYLHDVLIRVDYHSGEGSPNDFSRVRDLLQNEST